MASVNKVILMGRIGKDIELRYTNSGTPVASFSLATSESYKDKSGDKQEKTEWTNLVAWNKTAELCGKYLSKGDQIFIEGKLQTRSWEDNTGQKKYSTEVIINNVQFIKTKNNGSNDGQQNNNNQQQNGNDYQNDDDIPF